MEYSAVQGKGNFPGFCQNRPWHAFLYQARGEVAPKFPFLFNIIGNFDWGDRYPKSLRLSELFPVIVSLCWTRCDGRLVLDKSMLMRENSLALAYPELMKELFAVALSVPNFFVSE